jgi:nucleotide-binding universal stress UspA family protein
VCTDGSPYGDVACQYGFLLAKTLKAQLTGLHVLDVRMLEGAFVADLSGAIGATGYYAGFPQFESLMEAKGDAIRLSFEERAGTEGVHASFSVVPGHPFHIIREMEKQADLLILGQRGENEKYGRDLIGALTDRITRSTTKPCLITHSRFAPIRNILAACDRSPISGQVAATAVALAKAMGAGLALVTVMDKQDSATVRTSVETARRVCLAEGADPVVAVMEGHAAEALLDAIARDKYDLIVMGAHSHTRIREWFVGCVTHRVLSDSGIPALLVR